MKTGHSLALNITTHIGSSSPSRSRAPATSKPCLLVSYRDMSGHSMDTSVASEDTAQVASDYSPYADSKSVHPAAGLFEKGTDVWEAREWPIRRRSSSRQRLPFIGSRVSFGTLALFPLFARASAMKVCHDKNGRRILPGSLLAHSKLLDDLHDLLGYMSILVQER